MERIKVLIKLAVPSYKTKEALYLAVLTGLLVIRTYMSIWLADVNGQVVKAIVNKDFQEFLKRVEGDDNALAHRAICLQRY